MFTPEEINAALLPLDVPAAIETDHGYCAECNLVRALAVPTRTFVDNVRKLAYSVDRDPAYHLGTGKNVLRAADVAHLLDR